MRRKLSTVSGFRSHNVLFEILWCVSSFAFANVYGLYLVQLKDLYHWLSQGLGNWIWGLCHFDFILPLPSCTGLGLFYATISWQMMLWNCHACWTLIFNKDIVFSFSDRHHEFLKHSYYAWEHSLQCAKHFLYSNIYYISLVHLIKKYIYHQSTTIIYLLIESSVFEKFLLQPLWTGTIYST